MFFSSIIFPKVIFTAVINYLRLDDISRHLVIYASQYRL